jgi:hypothetical protein
MRWTYWIFVASALLFVSPAHTAGRKTVLTIQGREFIINGHPTYEKRSYNGLTVQGLLFNSRMVQGIFDDRNPETRGIWAYPSGVWDPERNTRDFIAAMPQWKANNQSPGRQPSGVQQIAAVGEFFV